MIAKISLFWKCMVPENANLCSERRLLIYSFVIKHKTVFIGKNIQHNIAHKTTLIREKIPQNLNKTDIYGYVPSSYSIVYSLTNLYTNIHI